LLMGWRLSISKEAENILAGKGFVLSGLAKKVKVLGHKGRELLRIAAEVGQQPLNGGAEVDKGGVVGVAHDLLAQKLPEAFDWFFILHLDCVARRNDCTISAKRIIILWLYGTPNGCSVEPDRPYIARL
jgi:hypothetical protein